ncbi:virion structural protein [Pseudomonas phage D6]|nr:virion structural protein [Pseudomonas phage D6]
MIEIQVALYDQRIGDLGEFVRGTEDKTLGSPFWITPGLTFETDGQPVHAFKTVPTLHSYEGIKQFQIWDKRSQSVKKLVATITVDAAKNQYHIKLEPYYQRRRLNTTFHVHGNYNRPPAPVAFHNKTHHGDWVFDNTI